MNKENHRDQENQKSTGLKRQKYSTSNKKETLRYVMKMLSIVLAILIVLGGVLGLFWVLNILNETPEIQAKNIYDYIEQNSIIYDNVGEQMEVVGKEEKRIIVPLEKIPETMQEAIVAVEDERFWEHSGLDYRRIVGATWNNLTTDSRQGGSTITQQLAKNVYLTHEQTLRRKIQDAYYAKEIESQLSKEKILEAYLNTINLGGQNHGVEAASQAYFSKPVSELDLVESALIAGITQHPARYSPIRYIPSDEVLEDHVVYGDYHDYTIIFDERTVPRYRTVLGQMLRNDYITEDEYREALEESERLDERINPSRFDEEDISGQFGEFIRAEVMEGFVEDGMSIDQARQKISTGGLRIYSTLDPEMQNIMEEEFQNPDNFPPSFRDSAGNLLRDEQGNVQPQGAMIISNPYTGEIKALMGGRETLGSGSFNRAVGTGRPVGSSIKPLAAFLPALDNDHTVASVIDDLPVYFDFNDPERRHPQNVGDTGYLGLINLREALSISSNVSATKLLDELDPTVAGSNAVMQQYLNELGIEHHTYDYSTVLGSGSASPYAMNRAYNAIANRGVYKDLVAFTHVKDSSGNVLLDNRGKIGFGEGSRRVVGEDVAYLLTDMMQHAVTPANEGYGWQAAIRPNNEGIPVAGKTGTSQEQKDAWFVGYTPYLSAATWIGYDRGEPLGRSSEVSARLWSKVMGRIHDEEGYSNQEFARPGNIIEVEVCRISGKLPTDLCERDPRGSQVVTELFIEGTEPTEHCEAHVSVHVHRSSGGRPRWFHLPMFLEERVYFVRPEPYDPAEHDGIKPRDYEYQLPVD
ncbi:transglycosylase domain-containing protein [Isachenkonia alkalipeptolytica]|uniref:Penicillin-binding protein 1A n=1 Tax=Isachenkonia alkalipeptolytica TaxID=2565777 RepID=A0AA43XLE2_9CLOT|nr:transglycosylase domain-containing protein [Isachenkonia alkalipeptolytica]NBG88399.1 penicillin-binding protein [Isachenkonia alkalipeptolytica]